MTTYAVPNGDGTYRFIDSATTQTFSIGEMSFPPPWLQNATADQRASNGILDVVNTTRPDDATNIVTGSSFQMIGGVPTQVWASTPRPAPTPLTPIQIATNAYWAVMAAGCQISSYSTPAINGVYAITNSATSMITSEQVYIATTGKFTNGQTSHAWSDISGNRHVFPTTALFTAFAEAVAEYVDALDEALAVADEGGGWVAPSMPAPLA
jgi:hypothetical protein